MIDPHPDPDPAADARRASHARRTERTCIACGRSEVASALLRLVAGPAEADGACDVAVDLSGGAFGRGAWVHPAQACIARAPRALSRSLKCTVRATPVELTQAIALAADRRVEGLLASAFRSRNVRVGSDPVVFGLETGEVVRVVVARDALAVACLGAVQRAVADGIGTAWGTKERLGAIAGRSELGLVGITSPKLAKAIAAAATLANGVGAPAEASGDAVTEAR